MKRGLAQDDFGPPSDDMAAPDHDSDSSWEDVGVSTSPSGSPRFQKYARKGAPIAVMDRPSHFRDTKVEDLEDGFVQGPPSIPLVVKYDSYPPGPTAADVKAEDLMNDLKDDGSASAHIKSSGSASETAPLPDTTTSTTTDSTKLEFPSFTVLQKVFALVLFFLAMQIDLDALDSLLCSSHVAVQGLMTISIVVCMSGILSIVITSVIDWLEQSPGKEEGGDFGPVLQILTKSLVAAFSCGAVGPKLFPGNALLGVPGWQKNPTPNSWWMTAHDLGLFYSFKAFGAVMAFGVALLVAKVVDAYIEDRDEPARTDEEEKAVADVQDELRGYAKKISSLGSLIWNNGILGLICDMALKRIAIYYLPVSAYEPAMVIMGNLSAFLVMAAIVAATPRFPLFAWSVATFEFFQPWFANTDTFVQKAGEVFSVGMKVAGYFVLAYLVLYQTLGSLPTWQQQGIAVESPSNVAESPSIVDESPIPFFQPPRFDHPRRPQWEFDSQPQNEFPGLIDCNEYSEGLPCDLVSKWSTPGSVDCSMFPKGFKLPCMAAGKWILQNRAEHEDKAEDEYVAVDGPEDEFHCNLALNWADAPQWAGVGYRRHAI